MWLKNSLTEHPKSIVFYIQVYVKSNVSPPGCPLLSSINELKEAKSFLQIRECDT